MSPREEAAEFVTLFEHESYMRWWTSIRLRDCGELVYRHAVIICSCGRLQSEAYLAWLGENPQLAAEREKRWQNQLLIANGGNMQNRSANTGLVWNPGMRVTDGTRQGTIQRCDVQKGAQIKWDGADENVEPTWHALDTLKHV